MSSSRIPIARSTCCVQSQQCQQSEFQSVPVPGPAGKQAASSGSGTTSTSSASGTTAASAASGTSSARPVPVCRPSLLRPLPAQCRPPSNRATPRTSIRSSRAPSTRSSGTASTRRRSSRTPWGRSKGTPPPSPPSWRLGQRDERRRFDRHGHVERCHDPNRHGIHDGGNSANVRPSRLRICLP